MVLSAGGVLWFGSVTKNNGIMPSKQKEEIGTKTKQKIQGAGHNIAHSWILIKWNETNALFLIIY